MHDKRLRDVLPQPPPALPPVDVDFVALPTPETSRTQPFPSLLDSNPEPEGPSSGLAARLCRIFETSRNSFSLFRRYFSRRLPSHDPDSEVDIPNLSDIVCTDAEHPASSFGPYPNKSSFHLGEWYWNHGVQKSQASFKELVSIVGDVDFQPSDIRGTKWDNINKKLAEGDCDEEWADETAGWVTSPVKISVPFHRFTSNPGPRDFIITNFHHRPLVSVIREKLSNENDFPYFHYEPYELLWKPHEEQNPVRIHGELYTSPAFIDAHNSLQQSVGEPGCELPRVVVALMFWSDGTHLTNFGNAKLWPLYMFYGNESKYRRGKPSCKLCEHVAYFETVGSSLFFKIVVLILYTVA